MSRIRGDKCFRGLTQCEALEGKLAREVGGPDPSHQRALYADRVRSSMLSDAGLRQRTPSLRIRRANGAAAGLLGFKDASELTGDLDSAARGSRLVRSRLPRRCARRVTLANSSMQRESATAAKADDPGGAAHHRSRCTSRGRIFPRDSRGRFSSLRDTRAIRRTVEFELLEKARIRGCRRNEFAACARQCASSRATIARTLMVSCRENAAAERWYRVDESAAGSTRFCACLAVCAARLLEARAMFNPKKARPKLVGTVTT